MTHQNRCMCDRFCGVLKSYIQLSQQFHDQLCLGERRQFFKLAAKSGIYCLQDDAQIIRLEVHVRVQTLRGANAKGAYFTLHRRGVKIELGAAELKQVYRASGGQSCK
jgi:hypothetical protein